MRRPDIPRCTGRLLVPPGPRGSLAARAPVVGPAPPPPSLQQCIPPPPDPLAVVTGARGAALRSSRQASVPSWRMMSCAGIGCMLDRVMTMSYHQHSLITVMWHRVGSSMAAVRAYAGQDGPRENVPRALTLTTGRRHGDEGLGDGGDHRKQGNSGDGKRGRWGISRLVRLHRDQEASRVARAPERQLELQRVELQQTPRQRPRPGLALRLATAAIHHARQPWP